MGCVRSKKAEEGEAEDELEGDEATIEVYDSLCSEDQELRRRVVELVANSWANAKRHEVDFEMHALRGKMAAAQNAHSVQLASLDRFQRDTEGNAIVSFLSNVSSDHASNEISISFDKFSAQWAMLSDADKRVTHSQVQIMRLCSDGLEKCAYTKGVLPPNYTSGR